MLCITSSFLSFRSSVCLSWLYYFYLSSLNLRFMQKKFNCIYLPVFISICVVSIACLSVCPIFVSICLFLSFVCRLFVCQVVCLTVFAIRLYIRPSSVCLAVVYLYGCLSSAPCHNYIRCVFPSVSPSVRQSGCLCVCVSVRLIV